MDIPTRQSLPTFTEQDWRSHGYIDLERDPQYSPLEGPIHPIFSFFLDEIPPGEASPGVRFLTRARWGAMNQDNHDILRHALRLATLMLESLPSLSVIHDISCADRQDTTPSVFFNGLPVETFFRMAIPNSVKGPLALALLNRLAGSVGFRFAELHSGQNVNAVTSPGLEQYPDGIKILGGDQSSRVGLASTINLKRQYLVGLQELYKDPENNKTQICILNFNLAVTICHELMHAIFFGTNTALFDAYTKRGLWVRGRMYCNEPFFADCRQAENGFLWESVTFGGAIGQDSGNLNAPVTVSEWPNLRLHAPEIYPWRTGFPANTVAYLVPIYYLRNIQSQRYWRRLAYLPPSESTFWIRKTVGVRFEHTGELVDLDWTPPKEETHTFNDRVVRKEGEEDRVLNLVNSTPDDFLSIETRIHLEQPGVS